MKCGEPLCALWGSISVCCQRKLITVYGCATIYIVKFGWVTHWKNCSYGVTSWTGQLRLNAFQSPITLLTKYAVFCSDWFHRKLIFWKWVFVGTEVRVEILEQANSDLWPEGHWWTPQSTRQTMDSKFIHWINVSLTSCPFCSACFNYYRSKSFRFLP